MRMKEAPWRKGEKETTVAPLLPKGGGRIAGCPYPKMYKIVRRTLRTHSLFSNEFQARPAVPSPKLKTLRKFHHERR